MTSTQQKKVRAVDVPPNTKRGGDLRAMLTPATVGSTSGFMGVVDLLPGEAITEHYHPYSEEYLYLINGSLTVRLDGQPVELSGGEALLISRNVRHRLHNTSDAAIRAVFALSPLAPRPDLGHVDTEPYPEPRVGSAAADVASW